MDQRSIDALKWIVGILNKHQAAYQISGGLAAKLYGSSRELHDIDIDMRSSDFSTILPDIASHITYGPTRFNDGKFDCDLITLMYDYQEIDLTGIESLRISNKARTQWLDAMVRLEDALPARLHHIDILVIPPERLIAYKQELDGHHQEIDIRAVEAYLSKTRAVPHANHVI